MLLLVLLGMYLKIQEKNLCQKLNKIKSNRRSKLPGNGAKFDITQITLRSELLSQIRGSNVVLRDRINKELGNLINLIRFVKLVCLMFLM